MKIKLIFPLLLITALWFIFFPPSFGGVRAALTNDEQSIGVTVQSSYTPEKIVVKKDIPVRIKFNVTDAAACSKIIVSSTLGIPTTLLSDGQEVVFKPDKAGSFNIMCTHGMYYLGVDVRT